MTEARAGLPVPLDRRRRALPALAVTGCGVAAALLALPLAAGPVLLGLGLYGLVAAVVFDRLPEAHPHARLGLANTITLARAGGAAVFAALAGAPQLVAGAFAWGALAAAAAVLALDGFDGWLARRQGLASLFGARFDMEVDALLILALAAIAAGTGKAGPWVLGLGLVRYGFVVAGWLWPALARPLPPSLRRKAVCVLQVVVLGLLLAPPVVPPLSAALAAAAFAALLWSFAVDLRWLIARTP